MEKVWLGPPSNERIRRTTWLALQCTVMMAACPSRWCFARSLNTRNLILGARQQLSTTSQSDFKSAEREEQRGQRDDKHKRTALCSLLYRQSRPVELQCRCDGPILHEKGCRKQQGKLLDRLSHAQRHGKGQARVCQPLRRCISWPVCCLLKAPIARPGNGD